MSQCTARLVLLLAGSIIALPARAATQDVGDDRVARAEAALVKVRATTPQLSARLRDGRARSATFRALLDRLEADAVLLYVVPGQCRRHDPVRLGGCLIFLGSAGGLRHFRIIVDDSAPARVLIATIGHELQHAVEIVDAGISARGDGLPGTEVRSGVYETEAALRTGRAILSELGAASRHQ